MDQGRKIQVLAVLALMIATMSLLVGFSSLNAQLELAGTANIKNNKWNVQIGSISNVQSTNAAYASFTNEPTVNINNSKQIDTICLGGKNQLGILVDGSVVLCCLDNNGDTIIGNIFKDEMEDILNSELYKNAVRKMPYFDLCKKCTYRFISIFY